MSTRRKAAAALAAAGLGGAAAAVAMGWLLSAPSSHDVGSPPEDLGAESMTIASGSGSALSAWYVPNGAARRAVVLLHGVRADRRSQIDRARLFRDAGYAVLLFDFQAHGESPGRQITFGWQERHDVIAAAAWMRQRHPDVPLAVMGQSMGGAAALYAAGDLDADALVVESVYGSLAEATENRLALRLGTRARPLAPLLTAQARVRLGVPLDSLRPAEAIRRITVPVFVASGTEDEHATPAEARRLYANAPEPKRLWLTSGAAHQDLHAFAPEAYRAHVLGWLDEILASAD